MNNRKFLQKVKRSSMGTIFGDRVLIIVKTLTMQENPETYWEKQSTMWKENGYYFYVYKTKRHHAKHLLLELQKKYPKHIGTKFLTK